MRKETKENMLLFTSLFMKQKEYWLEKLSGNIDKTGIRFPAKKSPSSHRNEGKETLKILLPPHLTQKMLKLSKQSDLSLYILLLAGLKSLLHRYTGSEDIIVVSPLHRAKIAEQTINSRLFIRDRVTGQMTFKELILHLRTSVLQAYENQDYPYDRLMEFLFDASASPLNVLSEIACCFQDLHETKNIRDLAANSKISFCFRKEEEMIGGDLEYDSLTYEAYYIERMSRHLVHLLEHALENLEAGISQIPFLSTAEKKLLLEEFNDTREAYPREKKLRQLFQEQAAKNPQDKAVIHLPDTVTRETAPKGPTTLTYGEVNRKANQVARLLREKGVSTDSLVGIMGQRSLETVVGMIGILKAGGAYLPLDPEYPQERIHFILNDCSTRLLLLQAGLAAEGQVHPHHGSFAEIRLDIKQLTGGEDQGPEQAGNPHDLAYVMYTSGSTGQPKGVMVSHRNVIRLVKSTNAVELSEKTRILQTGVPSFDAATFEVWGSLLNGGRLYLVSNEIILDSKRLGNALAEGKINTLWLSSPLFNQLARQDSRIFAPLRYLIVGGDTLSPKHIDMARKVNKDLLIVNGYGPTENTTFSTFFPLSGEPGEPIPIGKPIRNSTAYVVDKDGQPQPVGIWGELLVGGDGVARGYLNNPELTVEKFKNYKLQNTKYKQIPNYKLQITNEASSLTLTLNTNTLYKTGDLARWLPDGNLAFSGRLDHQVKIRGYRVEPGEIEIHLQKHPQIKDAVVTVPETRKQPDQASLEDKFLCAYIAFAEGSGLNAPELREFLAKELPDYMIPSHFVEVKEFSLTANGKIDRKQLAHPDDASMQGGTEYVAPRSAVELELVEICNNVLNREITSVTDNFFEIGGDSIKAIQIASRMHQAGYKIDVADIFQYPVVAELARQVKNLQKTAAQDPVTGNVPLTPNQIAFFLSTADGKIPTHLNQAVLLRSDEEPDPEAITAIFTKILEHHDALRSILQVKGDQILQTGRGPDYPLSLDRYDYRGLEAEQALETMAAKIDETRAGISPETGPLMKVNLFHLPGNHYLLIVINRLTVDAVSWRILLEDLGTLYQQYKRDDRLVLALKTDSLKLWAEKLREYANSAACLAEIPYWRALESWEFSPIFPEAAVMEADDLNDTGIVEFDLSEAQSQLLLTQAHHAFGTTVDEILLTALGLAIKKTVGTTHLLVALESDGREEPLPQLDLGRTVGWFAGTYPVHLDLSYENEWDWTRQIIEIKESLRQTPRKGTGYGILNHLTAEEHKTGIAFKLKPQTRFKYLESLAVNEEQMPFKPTDRFPSYPVSPGEQREYPLDITATLIEQRLQVTAAYNPNGFPAAAMKQLMNHYEAVLGELISFCSSREKRELTPSDMTYKKLSIAELEKLKEGYENQLEDIYGLSPLQEGMLFNSLYQADAATDFVQLSFRLDGELELDRVEKSLNELFKRHDILRTAFIFEGFNRSLQVVLQNRQVDFIREDLRPIGNRDEKEQYVKESLAKDRRKGFDLGKDVLMRVTVLQLSDRAYEFTWSFHHILMDGWCLGVLIQEFFQVYESYRENKPHPFSTVQPYRNYIQWLENRDKKESQRFWARYLADYREMAGIPKTKTVKTNETGYQNQRVRFALTPEDTNRLNRLAGKNHVTLNTLIRAAWGVLLGRYNRTWDVVFGVVVSGRPSELAGVETMIGLFINTIPLRIRYERNTTFKQLLQYLQQDAIDSEPHHYYPLAGIQAESQLKFNLLDHILVFENYPIGQQVDDIMTADKNPAEQTPLKFTVSAVEEFGQTNYDLNISIAPGAQLSVNFNYNANVYHQEIIERVAGQVEKILHQVIADEEITVEEVTLLAAEEKKQLLEDFNRTAIPYPDKKTLHELFTDQVKRSPDHIALAGIMPETGDKVPGQYPGVPGEEKQETRCALTYKELEQQSAQLARVLIRKGLQPDTIAGIMVERSIPMITGLLAILKSGGAYLPIDPQYPEERVRYMLADSEAQFLLTADPGAESLFPGKEVIDVTSPALPPGSPPSSLTETPHHSGDLAYILYTSGSTGRPKGVMVEQRSVARLVIACTYIDLTPGDRLLLTGNLVFDITTFEIWGSLLNGLALYLVDQSFILESKKLNRVLAQHCIDILHLVPQLFNQLAASGPEGLDLFARLRYFLVGGDLVRPTYINQLRTRFKNLRILHMYGPTENTTFSTFYPVEQEFEHTIPLGKPISNATVYVVDPQGALQPVGAVGELLVGGPGVARGYLNNPELTAEKFNNQTLLRGVQGGGFLEKNPPGRRRLYKTGDLARWLPGGDLEFLGRQDTQIKIRGIRIELGEIENVLLTHEDIKEAVVTALQSGTAETRLCAYLVAKPHRAGNGLEEKLGEHLARALPGYMIPADFIWLERMPVNPNGKIDRKALPLPGTGTDKERTPPRNEVEKKLLKIWSEILDREEHRIGIDDNFFQLGGHSLKATTLVSRIQTEFRVNVPMTELFKKSSLRLLGEYIDSAAGGPAALQENNLLLLRKESETAPPFFLIHDGSGEVEGYLSFCRQLDQGFNFWGIRADRLENHAPLNVTVEEMARKYIKQIQNLQPPGQGPYFLAGWSLGGVIAFEIARQLEKQNQFIAFLGLVDAPTPSRRLWRGISSRLKLGKFNLASETKLLKSLVMADEKIDKKLKEIKTPDQFWPTMIHFLQNGDFDRKAIKNRMMKYGMQAFPHFQRLNFQDSIYYLNMSRTLIDAVRTYRPTHKITAPIHYFNAVQTWEINEKQWQKHASAPVRFYEVPGDHGSIFGKYVTEFVRIFGKALNDTMRHHQLSINQSKKR